jgi:hypothetical protein
VLGQVFCFQNKHHEVPEAANLPGKGEIELAHHLIWDINQVTCTELMTLDGLCFTTSDFVETTLLKRMDDVHAHFLYQDVLNWAKEAKHFNYDFCPKGTTHRTQSNTLKNWHSYSIVVRRQFG